jgi:DNA-binding MarR family transcriptional regulator
LLRSTRARLYDRLIEGVDGVDVTTYPVLSGLARTGPTSASRLAEAIGLDRSATTRYATRLEAAGLLRRVVDHNDARATQLELTAAGRAAIAKMRKTLSSAFDELLGSWSTARAERFATGLEHFTEQLQNPARLDVRGGGPRS